VEGAEGRLTLDTGDGGVNVTGNLSGLRFHTGDGSIVYRAQPGTTMSEDWDITTGDGGVSLYLPAEFGFSIVVHPHQPDTIYVFPIGGGDRRYPPGAKARVWRSRDAGGSWEELGNGLPDSFYVAVMRDAMCTDDHDPAGVYFGARNGAVWASADEGDTWRQIVSDLPDVMVVRAASI